MNSGYRVGGRDGIREKGESCPRGGREARGNPARGKGANGYPQELKDGTRAIPTERVGATNIPGEEDGTEYPREENGGGVSWGRKTGQGYPGRETGQGYNGKEKVRCIPRGEGGAGVPLRRERGEGSGHPGEWGEIMGDPWGRGRG